MTLSSLKMLEILNLNLNMSLNYWTAYQCCSSAHACKCMFSYMGQLHMHLHVERKKSASL